MEGDWFEKRDINVIPKDSERRPLLFEVVRKGSAEESRWKMDRFSVGADSRSSRSNTLSCFPCQDFIKYTFHLDHQHLCKRNLSEINKPRWGMKLIQDTCCHVSAGYRLRQHGLYPKNMETVKRPLPKNPYDSNYNLFYGLIFPKWNLLFFP